MEVIVVWQGEEVAGLQVLLEKLATEDLLEKVDLQCTTRLAI